jgi:phosphoribosyl-AMP cyclohydrolase
MVECTLIASTLRVKIVQSSAANSPVSSLLKWNPEGLIPAIVQDGESGEVLMMAWMNSEALATTLETGQTHFYSRSRGSLWHKGGTSGHVQLVESIRVDCDADVLLIKVRQKGGACHEGYHSCFFRRVDEAHGLEIVDRPVFDAERVYGSGEKVSGGQ